MDFEKSTLSGRIYLWFERTAPKSMKLVATTDVAYAEHTNGKNCSGIAVGFESNEAGHFAFVSSK